MPVTEILCFAVVVVAVMLCVFLGVGCYTLYRVAGYLLEKELLYSHIRDVFRDVKYDFTKVVSKRMVDFIGALSISKCEGVQK